MATIQDLKKYKYYEFSSGSYTGEDYKKFQNLYINYLRKMCKEKGWELVNVGRNHYCFSAFIKNSEKYVYFSISDVRHFDNSWLDSVLIRRAKSEKDYCGMGNHFTPLDCLAEDINFLFNRW